MDSTSMLVGPLGTDDSVDLINIVLVRVRLLTIVLYHLLAALQGTKGYRTLAYR